MNAYTARQQRKRELIEANKARTRDIRLSIANATMARLGDAYRAVYGKDTLISFNRANGLYWWHDERMTRRTVEKYTAKLEARAAALVNPDEENA